ncbi:MAG: hypothetical protein AAGL34_01155 [Bacteroidota bacterium]
MKKSKEIGLALNKKTISRLLGNQITGGTSRGPGTTSCLSCACEVVDPGESKKCK